MRSIALALALTASMAALLAAQDRQSSTVTYDINGHRVDWSQSRSGDGRSAATIQNMNGRRVPLEQVEEKVISNEGGTRVVERIIRRNDATGTPLPPEKSVIETTTRPDGSALEKTTTYRGDLNGNLVPAERVTSQTRKSGATALIETNVERQSLNGGFQTVERRSAQQTVTKTGSAFDETTYRPDANGRFAEAARQVVRTQTANGQTQEQVDEYEAATTGKLKLARQSIGRTIKAADGSERKEVDVFGPAAPGRTVSSEGQMELREKQYFTSRQSGDGSVVQVFSVQRPSLNSTKELGPVQKIAETVCKGKCQ